MEPKTHTTDEIRQLYSILPSRVNAHLKKGDKIFTDNDWKAELEAILTRCAIAYTCKNLDTTGKNMYEIVIS